MVCLLILDSHGFISLSETDFEVVDSLGNIHIPMCAVLAPANENAENRTVLLLGEFGTLLPIHLLSQNCRGFIYN